MKNIKVIFQKEVSCYFLSPIAYVLIFFFYSIGGLFFYIGVTGLRDAGKIIPDLFSFPYILISFISAPIITMRLFAEEKKTGTIELLFTAPVKEYEVVIGKYLSSILLYLVMLSSTIIYIIFVSIFGKPDYGIIISNYIGIILLVSAYLAIGIFCSSLCKNQIVSALISSLILFILFIIGWVGGFLNRPFRDIAAFISFIGHFIDFNKGIVDTKSIIFYLTTIIFFLFLTTRVLEAKK